MIWIGGHMKSGTTWLKFIVVALIERTNHPKIVERRIPNLYNHKDAKKGKMYKTHHVKPPKGKKLYIVRHPVDVCVSGINHVAMSSGKTNKDKYVAEFIKKRGNVIADFGTWTEGVKNWTSAKDCHWMRYEDLLENTTEEVIKIADHLNIGQNNLGYTIAMTSFEKMRKIEKKGVKASPGKNVPDVFYNPKHKGYKKGRMFINKGQSGYAREILTEKQIEAICETFKEGMDVAGYGGYGI